MFILGFVLISCSLMLADCLYSLKVKEDCVLATESSKSVFQQHTACLIITCPRVCERYIDEKGCLQCGPCKPKPCPPSNCPEPSSTSGCAARVDINGCRTCNCLTNCAPKPTCAPNCRHETDVHGCLTCDCSPEPAHCLHVLTSPCDEPNCFLDRDVDGCLSCACVDDVYDCPLLTCDPEKKCLPVFDLRTGCATGCQCDKYYSKRKNMMNSGMVPVMIARSTISWWSTWIATWLASQKRKPSA